MKREPDWWEAEIKPRLYEGAWERFATRKLAEGYACAHGRATGRIRPAWHRDNLYGNPIVVDCKGENYE